MHLVTHRGASEQGVICFLLVTMAAPYSSTASASILSLRSSSYVLAFASNSAPPSACRVGGLYSGGPCDSFNTMRLNNGPSTTTKTDGIKEWHVNQCVDVVPLVNGMSSAIKKSKTALCTSSSSIVFIRMRPCFFCAEDVLSALSFSSSALTPSNSCDTFAFI